MSHFFKAQGWCGIRAPVCSYCMRQVEPRVQRVNIDIHFTLTHSLSTPTNTQADHVLLAYRAPARCLVQGLVDTCSALHTGLLLLGIDCRSSDRTAVNTTEIMNLILIQYRAVFWGSGDGSVVVRRARDPKVAGSSPGRRGARIFFPTVNLLYYFGISSTPMLPQ